MRATSLLSLYMLAAAVLLASSGPQGADAQFFRALNNFFRPIMRPFMPIIRPMRNFLGINRQPRGRFQDDGTQRPRATGRDELFPADCGRNVNDGTGKLCFPDGVLCQNSEFFFCVCVWGSR